MGPLDWSNSDLIKENVAEEIDGLKQQPGKDISISGSGSLVRSPLQDGLLDELRLMVHPRSPWGAGSASSRTEGIARH